MSQMLKSTGAIGAATLTSRVLGMAREIAYAAFMGNSDVAGIFKMALTIPNLFRRLLGEGALTAAFIPIFKEKEKTEGDAEMWKAANAVISGLIMAGAGVVLLVMIGLSVTLFLAEPLTKAEWLANAVGTLSADTSLLLRLTRVMFPYMLLACLAAILMGMLNARGHFFVPALGSCLMNLVMIASVFWLTPFFGSTLDTQIFALAYGILIAGVAQAAYQLPTLFKEGFRPAWVTPFHNPVVVRVIRQMVPGMLGVAAFQFNVLTTQSIAFHHDPSIVAGYDFAVRLMEFPQGLFGISLATYLLPTLSGLAAEKKYPEFRATYKQAVGYLFFTNLLASILLVVLAMPMVRLIFQYGKFDHSATVLSTLALTCLGPGLLAFSMVNITARAFYALGDTQTPMKISIFCLLANVVLAFYAVPALREGGMGVANTLSAGMNVYLLMYALKRKLSKLELAELRPVLLRMLSAGIVAGLVAYVTSLAWENYVGGPRLPERIGAVFVPGGIAALCYVAILSWWRVPQAHDILELVRAKLGFGKKKSP